MTHTLHPEILDEIVNSMNHYVDKHMYHALGMKKVLEKHLGPYLNMPQPIENEPKVCTACLGHKTHSKYTASKGTIEVNCSRCKGTGQEPLYDAKPKTYTLEQIEEEYDRGFTNGLLAMGGKKNDLKQSTPQIDRIDDAFKFYYEGENLYAFEECRDADKRIFREAILKHQPECQTCKMNKIAMKNPGKQS